MAMRLVLLAQAPARVGLSERLRLAEALAVLKRVKLRLSRAAEARLDEIRVMMRRVKVRLWARCGRRRHSQMMVRIRGAAIRTRRRVVKEV